MIKIVIDSFATLFEVPALDYMFGVLALVVVCFSLYIIFRGRGKM